jgi:hypothetical protein
MRELSANFIEMVQGGVSGRFETAGLEAEATGERGLGPPERGCLQTATFDTLCTHLIRSISK